MRQSNSKSLAGKQQQRQQKPSAAAAAVGQSGGKTRARPTFCWLSGRTTFVPFVLFAAFCCQCSQMIMDEPLSLYSCVVVVVVGKNSPLSAKLKARAPR